MSAAYEAWIYDQLEPDDKPIFRKKTSGHPPAWLEKAGSKEEISEEEKEKKQREYLKKHGIDF